MRKSGVVCFIEYIKVVKICWLIIAINAGLIVMFLVLIQVSPDVFGKSFYSVIEFVRTYLLFNIIDKSILDKIILIVILALPSIVAAIMTVYYLIRALDYKCPKCGGNVVKNAKVLMSTIPKAECPHCSIKLDVN